MGMLPGTVDPPVGNNEIGGFVFSESSILHCILLMLHGKIVMKHQSGPVDEACWALLSTLALMEFQDSLLLFYSNNYFIQKCFCIFCWAVGSPLGIHWCVVAVSWPLTGL
jgi:hypothetical protein